MDRATLPDIDALHAEPTGSIWWDVGLYIALLLLCWISISVMSALAKRQVITRIVANKVSFGIVIATLVVAALIPVVLYFVR